MMQKYSYPPLFAISRYAHTNPFNYPYFQGDLLSKRVCDVLAGSQAPVFVV